MTDPGDWLTWIAGHSEIIWLIGVAAIWLAVSARRPRRAAGPRRERRGPLLVPAELAPPQAVAAVAAAPPAPPELPVLPDLAPAPAVPEPIAPLPVGAGATAARWRAVLVGAEVFGPPVALRPDTMRTPQAF